MPRKPLIYTDEYPYHVTARSNNKEWFYIPMETLWSIYVHQLQILQKDYRVLVHAFVLMNNHYHLVLSTSADILLGSVMEYFQRSVSRTVNSEAGRINHVFGGPYKGCLINHPSYYYHAIRYVYRNPIAAGLSEKADEYRFSTLSQNSAQLTPNIETVSPRGGIDSLIPSTQDSFLNWVNETVDEDSNNIIKNALKRTQFSVPKRKMHILKS